MSLKNDVEDLSGISCQCGALLAPRITVQASM